MTVGGQRQDVYLNVEWGRYFESLNGQVTTVVSAVGLPGAAGQTGAAGSGLATSSDSESSVEFIPMPGPAGSPGLNGAALFMLADQSVPEETIQLGVAPDERRSFRVYRNTAQAIGGAGDTLVVFNAAQYDPFGLVNLTTGRVTLPKGVWLLGGSVFVNGTFPNITRLFKNAAVQSQGEYSQGTGAATLDTSTGVTDVVSANGTDVYDIRIGVSGACNVQGTSADQTYFWGVRIG